MTALAIIALALVLLVNAHAVILLNLPIPNYEPGDADLFTIANAVFDCMEADARARDCTQDLNLARKARQAFTHAALRGRR